ncbi:MAG: hypothetical protein IPL61_18395 [Myxococcales bacterium]|nr:hypothetical protein [Myxococcales bacterium]
MLSPRSLPPALVLVALGAASAAASPGASVGATRPAPGHVTVTLVDQRSLMRGVVGEPVTLALDGVVGLTPDLAIGVSHSAAAQGLMRGGGGLCRDSAAHVCDALYAGGYVDVRWRVPGTAAVTGLTRLGLDGVSPWKPVARLGVIARGQRGRAWWAAQPEVAVGLANRGNGNRDALLVPAWAGLTLRSVEVWLETGLRGEIDGFSEAFEIRLGLGGAYRWRALTVGATVGFPQLLGPQNTANIRVGSLWLSWSR